MHRSLLIGLLALTLIGCAAPKKGTVVARYPGGTITDIEVRERLAQLPAPLRATVLANKKEFVDELVNERFIIEEAKRRSLDSQPDVRELLRAARERILTAKLIDIEVDKKVRPEPGEAAEYYEKHKDQFVSPLKVRASQILVPTKAEADAALAEIRAGKAFAEVAGRLSKDPTASKGGDLGYFQKGQVIQEFEDKAFAMKVGDIEGPFQTRFGWHLLLLTDRQEPSTKDFASMRQTIERQIFVQKRSSVFKAFTERLRGHKKVEIDEKAVEAITAEAA